MPNLTPNYNLTLPLIQENYDINIVNDNTIKIDQALHDIKENAGGIIYRGNSSTAGATLAKIVNTTRGDFKKVDGATVIVMFSNAHTAPETSDISLNIDGTGASTVGIISGATPRTGYIVNYTAYLFQYNAVEDRYFLMNPSYVSAINAKANQSDLTTLQNQVNSTTIYQGTCATAAGTAAKVATVSGTFSRVDGVIVIIVYTYANTVASATQNVNNTGAAPIYVGNTAIAANQMIAGGRYIFQYNGTNARWQLLNPDDTGLINNGLSTKLSKSGDTATGNIVSYNPAPATSGIRNIYAGTGEMVSGTTSLATGVIYFQYE